MSLLIIPLLITGMGSVLYWYAGEKNGTGDLRLYGWVQFFPIVLSLLILFLFRKKDRISTRLLFAIAGYMAAKLCETFDVEIFNAGKILSGHTLKHLLASVSVWHIMMASIENKE